MSWIQRFTQHLGAFILPSTATVFFLGMAVYENGIVRVFKHVFRNLMILTPRVPSVIGQMWNERKDLLNTKNLGFTIVVLVAGMPFLMLFVLLDDYEE